MEKFYNRIHTNLIRYIAFGHNDCASEKYTNDSYVRRQNAALKSDGFGIFLAGLLRLIFHRH